MSIYALPGALHELISKGISKSKDESDACSSPTKDAKPVVAQDIDASSSCSIFIDTTASNPLHRKPSKGCASSPMDNGSDHSNSSNSSSSSCSSSRHGNNNVKLSVKEAKLDPERLIRSLATSSSSDAKKSESSGDDSSTNTSSSGQRRRRNKKDDRDPHEDAIKFEINVSFNGREYTATRTLPRILQFRCDLIEEFQERRKFRERRRKRKESVAPKMVKVKDLSDDEEEEKDIPELPRLADDTAHGNGFTMLNALLRPYGTGVERWLLKVLDIVPHDSQCLTQFLWEPISGSATSRKFQRRRSSLTSIQEAADDLSYDSDTDEFLLHH
ncbi:expressed unknown protein [Seminavis robusta]|uniref:Uncharacterized protein n=1 Tax=Seminavis robusta TaxID=568900 RepID=A0A9N8ELN4_9STRA|nr:expressed unknown protein [Seminavis robusta]|eukprot:Sro1136_g245160.1 n/a (329) ;mRNA; f:16153-17139